MLELRRCLWRYDAERGGLPEAVIVIVEMERGTLLVGDVAGFEKDVDRLVRGDELGDLAGGV